MKIGIRFFLCCWATVAAALPAAAQSPNLVFEIRDGMVRLDARDASVAQILERWSKVGAVTVVNAEAVASTRVTIRLDGVHFREALAIILRDAGGYIATSRPSRTGSGTELDRILISRSTPAAAPAGASTVAARRGTASRAEPPAATALPDATADDASADDTGDPIDEPIEPPARAAVEPPEEPQRYRPDGTPVRPVPGLTPAQAAALPPRPQGVVRGPEDSPITGPQGGKYGLPPQAAPAGPFGARGTSVQPGAVAPAPTPSGPQGRPPATAGNP